jgi:beta-mannosidase
VDHWQRKHRGYNRNELMVNQVREYFGEVPEALPQFIRASQVTQAEAKKFFVEQARIKSLGGVLWWNVIDCWPQISDAVVDYYFGKKLAYHYLWRVQRPVCLMIGEPDGWHVPLVADNLTRQNAEGRYRVSDADTDATLVEGAFHVPAGGSSALSRIRVFRGEKRLFLISWEIAGEKFGNHYALGSPPFSLAQYESWLPKLAALPRAFDPGLVGA